ncbi:MAG: tetratricopeptide repeat protein, partial [Vulcanimicrobiota bacterium]
MVRFKFLTLWVFLCSYVFLGSVALGQSGDPGRFGELATSEPFRAAQYYAENNFYSKALREYERVADENPGGDLEATARLLLAEQYFQTSEFRPGDSANHAQFIAKGRDQLERVIESFPGTRYAFVAKVMLIEGFGEDDWQREQLDPLIASVGGRTFAEILDDVSDPPFHERMIVEEYRSDVAEIYDIQSRGLPDFLEDRMVIFLIESFPYTNWRITVDSHFKRGLIPPAMSHDGVPPGMPTESDSKAPTILNRFPESGEITGLFPEIRITVVDGDFWARQPSMRESRLKLDGVDVTPMAFWKTKFDPTGTLPNFQEVTILYTPSLPLAPGQHSLELLAADGSLDNGNSATYTWTFTVDPNHGVGPTTETLLTTRDSTLIIRNPHQNEGANPRLYLKKVTGKPAQVVVGFDTSGIDTTGLTKASLVLNIDSTQNVTGWGNGRPVRAQRLLAAWTEGNSKKLGLPGNQQHSGSGNGVTWFSPIDGNIANSQADSAVNWN